MLRPEFEFLESPKQQAHARDEEVKRYTAEQFMALDAMETNPRVVFAGPAGPARRHWHSKQRGAGHRADAGCFSSVSTGCLAGGLTTRLLACGHRSSRARFIVICAMSQGSRWSGRATDFGRLNSLNAR
jgi:hypothetical protein